MKDEWNGWVVINIGHPSNGRKYIVNDSFSYTRKGAVKKFIEGTSTSWTYWRRKWNFRVVRAISSITTTEEI